MSVPGAAVEEGQGGDSQPVEIEPDVPKPAFELPPDKEDSGDDEPVTPKPGNRESRRAERRENFSEQTKRALAEAAQERVARQRMEVQIAELRGRMDARSSGEAADPHQSKLDDVATKIESALSRMGQGDAAAIKEWHQLRREEQTIIARRDRETAQAEAARNAPVNDPVLSAVRARYDWLDTDKDARQVAEGIVAKLVRLEGRDLSDPKIRKATLMQAAAEAERELGMGGGGTEPTETQRERFRGLGGQSTGAGRTPGRTMVALTGDQKAQAEALFRHLDPEAAHKEWWAKIGKNITNK